MNTNNPQVVYRKDYTSPDYLVDSIELKFQLFEDHTIVENKLAIHANYDIAREKRPLVLDGEHLELISIEKNGIKLLPQEYELTDKSLVLKDIGDLFELRIINKIEPPTNKALQGLYLSNQFYCTQCEPHGFRRITYCIDRPDVLSRFTTRIEADKKKYPFLLSNGNQIAAGDLPNGRHFVQWQDPFKKPTYLFALVAGDLAVVEEHFTTQSGRDITLRIFVEKNNIDQCEHALLSLKKAMKWDEEVFGLEYDLDIYMIVAVSDFNMGAMENKGLNIFNAKYILAKPSTATDVDYMNVQRVVAHEYFHNWTGNRVTLRDWFELSLKEGLTVFREQEFFGDMTSHGVRRIESAQLMCTAQFAEDASSLAHPIRPDSYIEINNFYTVTVYDKGAEVIRMLHRILGKQGFRRGIDKYFALYDGEAVTCDDFVNAMEQANEINLDQFRMWYSQVGTPELKINWQYDANSKEFILSVQQTPSIVLEKEEKQVLQIPLAISLLDAQGKLIPIETSAHVGDTNATEVVLNVCKAKHQFRFAKIPTEPTPSLLRGFSAPIKIEAPYNKENLIFLLKHDTDEFIIWSSTQTLFINEIKRLQRELKEERQLIIDPILLEALKVALENTQRDPALTAKIITIVSMAYVLEFLPCADVEQIMKVLRYLRKTIAEHLEQSLYKIYSNLSDATSTHSLDGLNMGRRALKNVCLNYLGYLNKAEYRDIAVQQFNLAGNMTDMLAAMEALNDIASEQRNQLLDSFIKQWSHEALVVDKWFAMQARADLETSFEKVKELTKHPLFDIKNPNKVYALLLHFIRMNWSNFHRLDGSAYDYITDKVLEIDQFNPSVAAYLAKPFTEWQRFAPNYQELMKKSLTKLAEAKALSSNVHELVVKSLK